MFWGTENNIIGIVRASQDNYININLLLSSVLHIYFTTNVITGPSMYTVSSILKNISYQQAKC